MTDTTAAATASCPTCGAPGRLTPFAVQQIVDREAAERAELEQLRRQVAAHDAAAQG